MINEHLNLYRKGLSFDDVLLVPKRSSVRSRSTVDISTKLGHINMDIPIIAANMDTVCSPLMASVMCQLGGFGVMHRNVPVHERFKSVAEQTIRSAVAFGVNDDLDAVIDQANIWQTQILVLDIAHGHSDHALDALRYVVDGITHEATFVGGNVATKEGVADFANAGANVVKIGIGPGSACTTRIVTGAGVPQLTAIAECAHEADIQGIQTIADGGIKNSGDIAKAIAAGADAVMLGNILAGTLEAPNEIIEIDGNKYKEHRGMASIEAGSTYPEGVTGLVPYSGSTESVISGLCKGITSACSYVGAHSLKELQGAEFIEITNLALRESKPHDIVGL